ncbi:MAG TPA: ROK family transcriptional regulator [Micromonosporaceae bacterium]|nr:ROK family transcriptional regulator [Micromonosporaceae bacterium]
MSRTRQPGTPSLLRAINDRAALELLLERGPLTRAQLGELTGLSKVTASQLVERLEERQLVTRVGELAGGRGPNAQLYAVVPSCAYVVGVHVGPREVVAASADITGRIAARVEITTDGADDPVRRVHAAVVEAAERAEAPWAKVRRIVLGTPGVVDPTTGDISFAFDLPRWHHGLREALSKDLGRPVSFENDVNLAAIAEAKVGAARDVDDFVLMWISRGVGVAAVIGGRLHRGAAGVAGEIGYLYVPGGPPPDYTRTGNPRHITPSFQQTINEKSVRALARQHGFRAATAADAVAAAVAGGPAGEPVVEELARRVALGVVAVCVVLDPPLVVLAGDVGSAGGEPLAAHVQEQVARLAPVNPRVVVTGVPTDPVLQGALLTGLTTTREEVFTSGTAERPR